MKLNLHLKRLLRRYKMSSKLAIQKRKARKIAIANNVPLSLQRWLDANAHDVIYTTIENGKEISRYTDGIIVGQGYWEK